MPLPPDKLSERYAMIPATHRRPASGGFTLIETLVVMVISVGLVAVMAILFRTVGHAAIALKGDNAEWAVQTLLRGQLTSGFHLPGQVWIDGTGHQLTFLTWRSRINGLDGQPVVAQYRYEPAERALTYREAPLPAWWDNPNFPDLTRLSSELATAPSVKLINAIESLEFKFLASDSTELEPKALSNYWQQMAAPKLVLLTFSRTRDNLLWLDVRSIGAS